MAFQGGGSRGVSELTGLAVLLGFVIVTASLVFVVGDQVVSDAQAESRAETGEILVKQFDARLGSVASAAGNGTTTLSLGDRNPSEVSVRRNGQLEVAVDGGACTATVPLPSIRFTPEGGDEVAYQAGGVWRRGDDGDSAMVAPPDLTTQGGALSVSVVDLRGGIPDDRFRLRKNVTASRTRTRDVRRTLYSAGCRRPDNVTVSVTSDYYRAWGEYLRSEVGTGVSVFPANRTARFTLGSGDLPPAVDDSRNEVVDLQDPAVVDPDPVDHRYDDVNFSIDKAVGNTYFVSARAVADGKLVGDIEEFDGGAVYRPPIDVVVVMDESGSMGGSKIADARDAARQFVGLTNESRDRIALVGYDTGSRFVRVGHQHYFSSDHAALNATVGRYGAGGGTTINRGLNASLAVHDIESNFSRVRHVILLTDGRNEPGDGVCIAAGFPGETAACRAEFDDRTLAGARAAANQDVVVHTIAFGSNADEDLLKDVKNVTGGTYSKATTGSELEQVFSGIFQNITETEQVVRRPVSTGLTVDGTKYVPQTTGNDSNVASHGGQPNINDPGVRETFSYAVNTSDAAPMNVSAVSLSCSDWQLTSVEHTNASTGRTYNEVRCTNVTGVDRTVPHENVTAYLAGADMTGFRDAGEAWWQPDLYNETLAPYVNASGRLDVESNQAIVVYDFPDSASDYGETRLVMRYEFGLPESTTTATVVDVDVTEVEARD
jgi:Mg-chelatase subunit ChlD